MISFSFLKKSKINEVMLGVLPDPRLQAEKKKDYLAEELVAAAVPFEWKERTESDWHKYPVFDQDYSSSCVAQSVAKALGIENFLEEGKFVFFSARDVYTRRINYPSPGMFFQNGMNIGYNFGATPEQLMISQGLDESKMNLSNDRTPLTELMAKIGKGGNYFTISATDMDTIANTIEPKGKGVILGVKFGPSEWNKPIPELLGSNAPYGHAIVATNAILHQGKKAFVIEDSWGPKSGIEGRRIVTEDWFKAGRITDALFYTELKNEGLQEIKPKYVFNSDLYFGMQNNDVIMLQKCLSYLKTFPTLYGYTGLFGGLTLKGVKLFQEAYKDQISTVIGKEVQATGYVGIGTRTVLNKLFV